MPCVLPINEDTKGWSLTLQGVKQVMQLSAY